MTLNTWNQLGLVNTEAKTGRRERDLYETEMGLTAVLTGNMNIYGKVLEPCSGPGQMATAIKYYTDHTDCTVFTNDINPAYETNFTGDAGDPDSQCWNTVGYDWVITNPPFSEAHRILPVAFSNARVGVAFLLRLTYAEPAQNGQPRGEWLRDHADHQVWQCTVNPRPKFRAGEVNPKTGKEFGTDSTTVAWFVWRKDFSWNAYGTMSPFGYAMNWRNALKEQ